MSTRKRKFKPVITRVKLNPEQAVLTCNCYNVGNYNDSYGPSYASSTRCRGYQQKGTMSRTENYTNGSSNS